MPLLGSDRVIGVLVVRRKQPGEFSKSTIELLQTFAAQSVLAIQNASLFENVEARTRELAKSLEDLRSTQDRLVQTQKLASLGQLTAGIAHEIKNPLNFVNNFSVVSSELIDELWDTVKTLPLDDKARSEIDELTNTLRGNLDKVVQHGKRADAIVAVSLRRVAQRLESTSPNVRYWTKADIDGAHLFHYKRANIKAQCPLQRPHEPLNQSSGFPTSNALVLTSRFGTSIRQFDIHAD